MPYIRKSLAEGRWKTIPFIEQMAHIAADVGRALNWRQKGNQPNSLGAYGRALELCDLTISDPKNESQLEELKRTREILVDYFVGDNQFDSTEKQLRNDFDTFVYEARRDR